MGLYFTVDRNRTLKEGQLIDLAKYSDVTPPELQTHADFLFPDGVTSHGEYYFLRGERPAKGVNEVIELLFDYVRKSYFPSCPSRFQSVFAFKTIDQALHFKNNYGNPDSTIYEVESDKAFRADMRLLTLQGSLLLLSYDAHKYWQGISCGDDPIWEYLLSPPVKVIRKINE